MAVFVVNRHFIGLVERVLRDISASEIDKVSVSCFFGIFSFEAEFSPQKEKISDSSFTEEMEDFFETKRGN